MTSNNPILPHSVNSAQEVFSHYLQMALREAGVSLDNDSFMEINYALLSAFEDVFSHIAALEARVKALEAQLTPPAPAAPAPEPELTDDERKLFGFMVHDGLLFASRITPELQKAVTSLMMKQFIKPTDGGYRCTKAGLFVCDDVFKDAVEASKISKANQSAIYSRTAQPATPPRPAAAPRQSVRQAKRQSARNQSGRYEDMRKCEVCGTFVGNDYYSDRRVDDVWDDTGICLCQSCYEKADAMDDDAALAFLTGKVAAAAQAEALNEAQWQFIRHLAAVEYLAVPWRSHVNLTNAALFQLFAKGYITVGAVDGATRYTITAKGLAAISPAAPEPAAPEPPAPDLEARLTSGKPEDRVIARDELAAAIDVLASGNVQPVEGYDFVRMPQPPAPRPAVKLTSAQRTALTVLAKRDNWIVPAYYGFTRTTANILVKHGYAERAGREYRITPQGRKALEGRS